VPIRSVLLISILMLLFPTLLLRADTHRCEWVYDGDTIRLENGERVRLLGVDAPELHHPERGEEPFGREARDLALSLVAGRTVELRYHEGNDIGSAQRDRYDRVLAYVLADGTCLNLALLEAGLARATRAWAHPEYDRYLAAERAARSRGAGLWSSGPSRSAGQVLVTRHGARYHRPDCPHIKGRTTRTLSLAAAEKRGFTPCRRCRP